MKAMRPTRLPTLLLALHLAACASLPAGKLEGGAPSTEVPARFFGEHVLVQVRIAEAAPVWLLLDSGAQMTILDLTAARELRVPVGGMTQLEGIGAEIASGGVTAEPISIQVVGSEPYRLHRPVADLSALEPWLGTAFEGILGADAFMRFVVEIDYAAKRVILHDPAHFRPHPADTRLALEIEGQLAFVRGSVVLPDGRELGGRFNVDTGSGTSLSLTAPFVRAHGIMEALPATIPREAVGVGGQTAEREGRLRGFRMGPFLLEEPVASLSQAEAGLMASDRYAGLIGGEVLRRFTVTIDYRRGGLYLRPNPYIAEPFEADMAGFMVRAAGADLREHTVHRVAEDSPAERAGLRVGDVIIEVDGRPAAELTRPELRASARGEPGQVLRLVVRRGGETHSVSVRLERRI